jgi:hypothetical protein
LPVQTIDFQTHFLEGRRTELRRLARFTDQPLEELQQEAALIAMELQSVHSQALDFAQPDVQAEIFRRLRQRFERVKRQRRRHTSLDQPLAGPERQSSLSLVDLVPAEEHADPLRALLREEDRKRRLDEFLKACRKTYSQFAAYLVLLWHFGGEREEAADYLAITAATFDSRIGRARASVGVQPSMFDGKFFVDRDFWPRRGRRKERAAVSEDGEGGQLALFDAGVASAGAQ